MRKLFILSMFFAFTATVNAQLLWTVSGNGLEKPSYLFGTYHLVPEEFIDSVAGLNDAILATDQVMVEIEEAVLSSPEMTYQLATACIAPADSTLDVLLSADDYRLVDSIMSGYMGMSGTIKLFNNVKPAVISVQLEIMEAMKYFPDYNAEKKIDGAVENRARKAGKPAYSLESADTQIAAMLGDPLEEQAKNLVEICQNDSLFYEYNRELIQAYYSQDLDALWQVLNDDDMGNDNDDIERLIYSRNRAWVEKIKDELPLRSTLVCVGAGHLPGEQGLIALLRGLGYTVKPYKQQ